MYAFTYTDVNGTVRRVRERFLDAAEGDAFMEERWREMVRPEDHIWCLGDLCLERGNHRKDEFIRLFKSLPGHKRLILGNHDHYKVHIYAEAGFQKIRASTVLEGLLLTHYPIHPSSISFKILANVHGHTHRASDLPVIVEESGKTKKWLNVSVERTDYSPIAIEEVRTRLEQLT